MTQISFSGNGFRFWFSKGYTPERKDKIARTLAKAFNLNDKAIADMQERAQKPAAPRSISFGDQCSEAVLDCAVEVYKFVKYLSADSKPSKKEDPSSGSNPPKKIIPLTEQIRDLKNLERGKNKTNKKIEMAKEMGKALLEKAIELFNPNASRLYENIHDPEQLTALASAMVVDLVVNAGLRRGKEIREAIQIGRFAVCYALIEQIGTSEDPDAILKLLNQLKQEATKIANCYGKNDNEKRIIFKKIYAPLQAGAVKKHLDKLRKESLKELARNTTFIGRVYDHDTLCRIGQVDYPDYTLDEALEEFDRQYPKKDSKGNTSLASIRKEERAKEIAIIKKRFDPATKDEAFQEFAQKKRQKAEDNLMNLERLIYPDFSSGKVAIRSDRSLMRRIGNDKELGITDQEIENAGLLSAFEMHAYLRPVFNRLEGQGKSPTLTAEVFSQKSLDLGRNAPGSYTRIWEKFPVLEELFPKHSARALEIQTESLLSSVPHAENLGAYMSAPSKRIIVEPKKERLGFQEEVRSIYNEQRSENNTQIESPNLSNKPSSPSFSPFNPRLMALTSEADDPKLKRKITLSPNPHFLSEPDVREAQADELLAASYEELLGEEYQTEDRLLSQDKEEADYEEHTLSPLPPVDPIFSSTQISNPQPKEIDSDDDSLEDLLAAASRDVPRVQELDPKEREAVYEHLLNQFGKPITLSSPRPHSKEEAGHEEHTPSPLPSLASTFSSSSSSSHSYTPIKSNGVKTFGQIWKEQSNANILQPQKALRPVPYPTHLDEAPPEPEKESSFFESFGEAWMSWAESS